MDEEIVLSTEQTNEQPSAPTPEQPQKPTSEHSGAPMPERTRKRSPGAVTIALFLTWLCAWLIPELTVMLAMYQNGYGLSRWQFYLCALPGLLLMAVFLNHAAYASGIQNDAAQEKVPWKERMRLYFASVGKGLPATLGIAAVFMVGRLLSQTWLASSQRAQWVAAGILAIEIVLSALLLTMLVRLWSVGTLRGKDIAFRFLALIPALFASYGGMGLLISLAEGAFLSTGQPMFRLCVRMLAAALDALLTTPVLLWLTKPSAGGYAPQPSAERKHTLPVAYGAAAVALIAAVVAGRVALGKAENLPRLTREVERHSLYLRAYTGLDDFYHMLAEDDVIEADLLLWRSTLRSGSDASQLRKQAVDLGVEDGYTRLMIALTADSPIRELENMLFAASEPDTDVALALLRLYDEQENQLTERQEALRRKLLLYLIGSGSYLDKTEIPQIVYKKTGTDRVRERLDALASYDLDLAPWEYMAEIMKSRDSLSPNDKARAAATYFREYHDPESVLCVYAEEYFLDLLDMIDWGTASAYAANDTYLSLAEEFPRVLPLQYMAAKSLLLRSEDGYGEQIVARHVAAAERYLKLYEEYREQYREYSTAYVDYADMIHATQRFHGLENATLEFDGNGLENARFFVGSVYYAAGGYDVRYYDYALELLGEAQDFKTRNLLANIYFDRKDYETCLDRVETLLSEPELTQGQQGQLLYLSALCKIPLNRLEDSLRDAAALADLVRDSEGADRLELEWLLFGYVQEIAAEDHYADLIGPVQPNEFTDEEWAVLSGNRYLYAFYNALYASRHYPVLRDHDGTQLLDEETGLPVYHWKFTLNTAEELLAEEPNLATMWYLVGGVWHEGGEGRNSGQAENSEECYNRAVEALQKALALDPENGKIWFVLASVYQDMGDSLLPGDKTANYEKAYDAVRKALAYMGEDARHTTDAYGSVIHAQRLLRECQSVLGIQ